MTYSGKLRTMGLKGDLFIESTHWVRICNLCFEPFGRCDCVGENAIEVDSNIAEILRLFHSKKYQTVSCCEGHIRVYETEKGNVYTTYSSPYITFDIRSLEDMKKEIVNWKDFEIEILDNNRYQINGKSLKVKGDRRYTAIDYKRNLLNELVNNIKKMKEREWAKGETLIQTTY